MLYVKLSPSEFARISNYETIYEGTKLVKSAKLHILISRFEEIKMLEEETFGEFYTKISDLRNLMVSLRKTILDVKLIRKNLDEMKIEELVGSLQTYEYSLPPVKMAKAFKKKARVSFEEDSDNEEDAVVMLAKNFGRLMKNNKFKKKFTERLKKAPRESEPKEGPKRSQMF
jgi:phosphoglucomutase